MDIIACAAVFLQCITRNPQLHVRTFNLSRETCIAMSAWCTRLCYGAKGLFKCSPDVGPAHDRNMCFTCDLDAFVEGAVHAMRRWRKGAKLRIHSLGEFYSPDYYRAWLEIARRTPHVKFAAYTRTWRLGPIWRDVLAEAHGVENFSLILSTDPTTGVPSAADGFRRSFILDPDYGTYSPEMPAPNCHKQTGGTRGCLGCPDELSCFSKAGPDVTFIRH